MEITINDHTKILAGQLTVQQLLDLEIPDKQKGIAVAINQTVVPKTAWGSTPIADKDRVMIIKATQGG